MGIKKTMAAVMTFGAVALGSTTASAYTPTRHCETVTQERVVDGPGRRDRVVTTTTQTCSTARHAARPATRVVKTRPRVVVRKGRVVLKPSVTIVKKQKAKRSRVVRKPATRKVVKRSTASRSRSGAVVTKTTTRTTAKAAPKRKIAQRRSQKSSR